MEWIIARWVTFVASLLIAGACTVGLLFLPRANTDEATRVAMAREVAQLGIAATLALIPATLLRLTDQLLALQSPGDPVLSGLRPLLTSTTWGTGFLWQCAAIGPALLGFYGALRAPRAAWCWVIAAVGAVGLCATPALQGHAIGSEESTVLAVAADVAHVIGASIWLGALGVIAWLARPVASDDSVVTTERRAHADVRLRTLVPLVPPIALPGAALLIGSGVIASVLHLRGLSDLWREDWGRYVLAKSIGVGVIVALGALNWRRIGPRMAQGASSAVLRKSLAAELVIALLILLVTAILIVTPLPGESDDVSRNRLESQHLGLGRSMPPIFEMLALRDRQQQARAIDHDTLT